MQKPIHLNDLTYTDSNLLIKDYMPFIIKSISQITNRYVSVENDDSFSIGLAAFYEAICKYDESRGPFLPFAKLVMRSRLLTYLQNEQNHPLYESLDDYANVILPIQNDFQLDETSGSPSEIAEEIQALNTILEDFHFTLEALSTEGPKHTKTRETAIDISEKISIDPPIMNWLYVKKRLPITQISLKYQITQKVIKGSKKFIITVAIILDKNLRNLKLWIRK